MAKISGFINDVERAIVRRVRQVRFENQLSQTAFARALDTTRDCVANIEYARTPLTVDLADKISEKFDVSLAWLAAGIGRMKPCIGLVAKSCPEIKPSSLLSRAYSPELLKRFFQDHSYNLFVKSSGEDGIAVMPKGKGAKYLLERFHHDLDVLFQRLPHAENERILGEMVRLLEKYSANLTPFDQLHPSDKISPADDPLGKRRQLGIDIRREVCDADGVKTKIRSLPDLMNALRKCTKERGQKSALARKLKVSRQAVDQWLAGKSKPSAGTTLELLKWVEQQERQKQKARRCLEHWQARGPDHERHIK